MSRWKCSGISTQLNRQKASLLTKLTQDFNQDPTKRFVLKELGTAVSAGGDKLQLARLIAAAVDRH
jgi:hypothetical protein